MLSLVGLVLRLTAYGHIQDVAAAMSRVFPREITTSIDLTSLLKSLIDITGPLAIAALLGLLWLGSNLFSNMENAFSIIFRIRGRDLVPQRLMALGMVLLVVVTELTPRERGIGRRAGQPRYGPKALAHGLLTRGSEPGQVGVYRVSEWALRRREWSALEDRRRGLALVSRHRAPLVSNVLIRDKIVGRLQA